VTVSNRRLSLFGCRREPVDETELTTVQIAVASQGVGEGKIGGGGCIAYALFKLGVFRSIDQAKLALDRAGEAIFRRRARVHKPSPYAGLCYPKAKVCVALLAPHHHNHHTHRHPITVSVSLSLHLCACVSLSQVHCGAYVVSRGNTARGTSCEIPAAQGLSSVELRDVNHASDARSQHWRFEAYATT
jgi:hypothetical protein